MGHSYIAYYRVSTQRQGISGLGLEAQREAVERFIEQNGGTVLDSFQEIESGGKADRPQLAMALERCRLTCATLIVAKLDRLARDMSILCRLRDAKVSYIAADEPHASELIENIRMSVAIEEKRLISERTKRALARKKAQGVKLGNPLGVKAFGARAGKGGPEAMRAKAEAFAERLSGIVLPMYDQGLSLRQIASRLNEASIPAPRGGAWRPGGVQRVIARLRPAGTPEVGQDALAMVADAPEARAPGSCTDAVPTMQEASAEESMEPKTMQSDGRQAYMHAVLQYGAFSFVPEALKTEGICLEAVKHDGKALEFVPDVLKTAEICLEAVKRNGKALKFVPDALKTSELCMVAVRQNFWALEFVPEEMRTQELYATVIHALGTLQDVPNALRMQAMTEESRREMRDRDAFWEDTGGRWSSCQRN